MGRVCEFSTVRKFRYWAESLPDNIDFIDYWYNLFLSKTKAEIDGNFLNSINAFDWFRWRNDFEIYVDKYQIMLGKGYSCNERGWFAHYIQYLIQALDRDSKDIAEFYGKEVFRLAISDYIQGHCCSVDWYMDYFVRTYGYPSGVTQVIKIGI